MEDFTRQFEGIEGELSETMQCFCGCGQVFPVFFGRLRYSGDYELVFVAGHLGHGDSGPHVWFTLGSGPWFEDARNCWVTMQLCVDEDGNVWISRTIMQQQSNSYYSSRRRRGALQGTRVTDLPRPIEALILKTSGEVVRSSPEAATAEFVN